VLFNHNDFVTIDRTKTRTTTRAAGGCRGARTFLSDTGINSPAWRSARCQRDGIAPEAGEPGVPPTGSPTSSPGRRPSSGSSWSAGRATWRALIPSRS
jgi:hypothetical protein